MQKIKKLLKRKNVIFFLAYFGIFILLWTQPNFNESGTIKIWDRNNTLLYQSAGNIGRKIQVTYDKLPKHLIDALISSEDITFWTNPGVDFRAIARSAFINIQQEKLISGASTITQQLARSAIISPGQISDRSIQRKIREVLMAIRINLAYSKKDIITMYFNQMYFGNLSYGIQATSTTYFDKDTSQLSLAESAFLIGLLSSPDKRDPYTNIDLAKARQAQVLDLMNKNNFISKEEAENAKQEVITLAQKNENIKAPHFVHFVLQQLDDLGIKSSQGINVYTTLDYPTFTLSENIAKLWINKLKQEHDLSNASLVLIKNNTGEIIDMLGGIDYFDSKNAGQVNMTLALRQPGSALKPITYAAAFMQEYTPATLIYDVPTVYKTKKGEGYTPNNYDGQYHGLILAHEALASSLNEPAVEMLSRVGIPNFLKVVKDMGITTLNQEDRYDLSLTLGGGEVKLLDLANVYASFARGGNYKNTYAIEKITSDKGIVLYEHKIPTNIQALGKNSAQVAYLISSILSDPKARMLGFYEKNPLVLSQRAAVKTGTTTDWHDNWTIGYTPIFTVGVWVGNNDNHPMKNITGVVGAAPIWNQFFEEFLKGKKAEQFIQPGNIKTVEICKLTGKLPDELCTERTSEIFIAGSEPKDISNIYKKVIIDKRNGLLATDSCPKDYLEEKVFIDYPPQVYTWALKDNQIVIPREFSPLCSGNQQVGGESFLQILSPRGQAIFQSAPDLVSNQAVVFEVSVSANISKVIWYLDNNLYKETASFPFKASWKPQVGKHKVTAIGITNTDEKINSKQVQFEVVGFKD